MRDNGSLHEYRSAQAYERHGMTQLDTKRGQSDQTVLRDVLHMIATNPDQKHTVLGILQMAQKLTGAIGAAFLLFDEPRMQVEVGGERSPNDKNLQSLAKSLDEGLHVNPKISDNPTAEYTAWLAAPIRIEQTLVGIFWLSFAETFQLTKANRPTLTSLVDSLTVIAMNAQVQERHEDSHQLTVSVLNSITDPLLVVDEHRKILLMNPAAEAVFNMPTAHAQGKLLREVVQSDALVKYAEGEDGTLEEWTTDDGKTFVPRMEPVYDADGPIEGWVLALRDVTRFKQLNRNQSEFMRIVSHDLRSPLTSMQGFASMLELGLVGELNEKQAHFVEKILSGITQMTSLVDNIQDAGRFDPETGFYELARSQCDLGEMVNRIVENHLVPAEKQELTISASVGEDVPIINADTNMLERAVINLVDNAIKYTPNGGKIQVAVKRRNDEVVVSVSDNGLGISQENQQHVFDRHVRIPRKEHKKVKGSGLGLFIVRSVAQRHGGDAWLESAEGQGTTFFVSVPLEGANLVAPGE
jgi:signal transduction histidine kinase